MEIFSNMAGYSLNRFRTPNRHNYLHTFLRILMVYILCVRLEISSLCPILMLSIYYPFNISYIRRTSSLALLSYFPIKFSLEFKV